MSSSTAKVRRPQGADALEIDDDGKFIVDGTTFTGAELKALLALVAAVPDTDQEDEETVWNDNGVLKVSSDGQ